MGDEQEPKQSNQPKSVLGKGLKKLKDGAVKEAFRKVILAILAKLLPIILAGLVIYVIIAAISYFIDSHASEEYKAAQSSTIDYTSGSKEPLPNKLTVNPDNMTSDGAYELKYNFQDEDGNSISEQKVIEETRKQLEEENEKVDTSQFTDSELKILGTLMSNGLETGKYNEKELKALVLFVKAEIAGQTFNLTPNIDKGEITAEQLEDNDKVFGTIEVHKTTATSDGNGGAVYKEIKLEYEPYNSFCSMIENVNNSVLEKFSIDEEGYLVIAKPSSYKAKYTYESADGGELSEADLERITGGTDPIDVDEYMIREYPLQIDYKQYVKKYMASYGFLSDLLLETNNVDFCLEIAELAFNSKIVLNIREEQVDAYSHDKTNFTTTTLYYDYVSYNIRGYKVTTTRREINSGRGQDGAPEEDELPDGYEISWEGNKWTLYKVDTQTDFVGQISETDRLIDNEHVSESYEGYSINEYYTNDEVFSYNVTIDTTSQNFKYEIDISEIDCWYYIYKRQYPPATIDPYEYPIPDDVKGEYPQEATVHLERTEDSNIINSDEHVGEFIEKKKQEYLNSHSTVTIAEGEATALKIDKKEKTDTTVLEYEGKRTTYCFGDESNLDITTGEFKNVEYTNNVPTYTETGKKGFLYVYDQYISKGIDLHLENDAEKELFELLEADNTSIYASDIIKFFLYVYDGTDRGMTDLDLIFTIADMDLMNPYNITSSAFGCFISRDEFISRAEAYGTNLANSAPLIYDVCQKYSVNPCIVYAWIALESNWGEGVSEDVIEYYCKWIVNAADPSSLQYGINYTRTKEYEQVNDKFSGTPDVNIYSLFCTYPDLTLDDTHTDEVRENIGKAYNFLTDGVYECNHLDTDETTLKEKADYMQYQIEQRIKVAEDIFGKNASLGNASVDNGSYTEIEEIATGGAGWEPYSGLHESSSHRIYVEWIQGHGAIGRAPMKSNKIDENGNDTGRKCTMGEVGCGVYACATLASSTGIEPNIWDAYNAYMSFNGINYLGTIQKILDTYGVDATACQGNANDHQQVISVLKDGRGVMIYVGSGFKQLYTRDKHWITLADIRETTLNSTMGYDIYALTSGNGPGHGWHPIETVLENLKAGQFYYIEDNFTRTDIRPTNRDELLIN